MAIFGAGSNWGGEEIKNDFFDDKNFIIGWNISDANDLYSIISTIKVGDIIYLKANRPGSLDVRVKGIGIVKSTFVSTMLEDRHKFLNDNRIELPIEWVCKDEFIISIPNGIGKLTNVRAATLYEEFLPYVQNEIINKIISKIK